MPNSKTDTSDPTSLFARLKVGTRLLHDRVEAAVGLPRTLAEHVHTLTTFYGFIEPWEAAGQKTLETIPDLVGDRRKLHLLVADLRHLGFSERSLASLPRCTNLPSLKEVPAVLGSMYVFEGATLGGRILSKHVEERFGLQGGSGYSFYRSYGDRVGAMWAQFGTALLDYLPVESYDMVVDSARDTFSRLCGWFDDNSPQPWQVGSDAVELKD